MTATLIRNTAWAVVWDAVTKRHAYAQHRDILLRDGKVASIAPHATETPPPSGTEVVDGSKLLVLPGLVNIHTHPTTEPGHRGVREDHGVPEQQMSGLFERSQAMKLGEAGQRAAMRLAYAELMSGGVTSVVDLSAPFPGWIDTMAESGMRVWAGPGFASARWGMSAPQSVEWLWTDGAGRAGFERAMALMAEAEANPCGRLAGIVFPAQIDTVEPDLLRDAHAYAEQTGRPFTTHIAQAVVEVREMIRRHGVTPIRWAADLGILSSHAIMGHAIFVDEHPSIGWHTREDIALLSAHGATVAHCPSPFARYGEHLKNFGRYVGAGVNMGMGTDCAPHNLIEEMRLAVVLARNAARDLTAGSAAMVFQAATAGGADALGRPDLGRLVEGAAADCVLVDLGHPLMNPPRDPLRSLVWHAADRAVRRVICGGETILADGKPTKLNVADAAGELAEAQARMLRDAKLNDYRGRDGDAIAPLSFPILG